MDIKTKLNVDDEAFILYDDSILKVSIKSIHIEVKMHRVSGLAPEEETVFIKYKIENNTFAPIPENEVFPTPLELTEDLLKTIKEGK